MKRFIITDLEDAKKVNHCNGCFGCFFKDPGRCILNDECKDQGQKIGHCEEIILISRLTFGGYSRIAKKRFDRSLPFVHGDFHIFHGQMHHKGRYENDPTLKVYFYGPGTDNEKENAKILVERNSYNLALNKYETYFCDTAKQAMEMANVTINDLYDYDLDITADEISVEDKNENLNIAILNGSPRGTKGASGSVCAELRNRILQISKENTVLDDEIVTEYLENPQLDNCLQRKVDVYEYDLVGDSLKECLSMDEIGKLCNADWMIFIFPLYLDSPSSNLQACLEDMVAIREKFRGAKVSCIALAGLYEGVQTETAIRIMKYWSKEMGFEFIKGSGFGGSGSLPGLKKIMPGEGIKKGLLELYDEIIMANEKGKSLENSYKSIGMTLKDYQESCEGAFRGIAAKNGFSLEDMGKQW